MNRKQRRANEKVRGAAKKSAGTKQATFDKALNDVIKKAIAAAQAGALAEAEDALREAEKFAPDHREVKHQLGMVLARTGRLDGGIAYLKAACELAPEEALYWNNLCAAHMAAGQVQAAADAARRAAEIDPKYAMALYNLGLCLRELKRPAEAVEPLRRLTALTPNDPTAWVLLAVNLIAIDNLAEAVTALERCIELDPKNAEARNNLGYLLLQRKQPGDALPHFEYVVEREANNFLGVFGLGQAAAELGNRDVGLRMLKRATSIDPRSAAAWLKLAQLAEETGDTATTKMAAERAQALAPSDITVQALAERVLGTGIKISIADAVGAEIPTLKPQSVVSPEQPVGPPKLNILKIN